ncbi:tetratricopeptide repeat protein [Planctomycetota bacterium]
MKKIFWIILIVFLMNLLACTSTSSLSTQKEETDLPQHLTKLLETPDAEIDLARTAFMIAKEVYPELDIDSYVKKIDNMVAELEQGLTEENDPEKVINTLSYYIYRAHGYSIADWGDSNVKDYHDSQACYFLNEAMDKRFKVPVDIMTVLFLVLFEKLELPIYCIHTPVFSPCLLRYDDGQTRINIEIEIDGLITGKTDEEYKATLKIPSGSLEHSTYLNKVSKKKLVSLLFGLRAEYYLRNKTYDKALRDNKYALKLAPLFSQAQVYYHDVLIYKAQEQYVQAFSSVNKLLELEPGSASGYILKALLHSRRGEIDQAIFIINVGIDKVGYDYLAWLYSLRGYFYTDSKHNYEKAIKDYTKAIELDPNYLLAYSGRGEAYIAAVLDSGKIDTKVLDKAVSDFTHIIKYSQNKELKYVGYASRARVLGMKKAFREAIPDLKRAIELDPKRWETYSMLALMYYEIGDDEKSYKYFLETIKRGGATPPGLVKKLEKLGYSLFSSDKPE